MKSNKGLNIFILVIALLVVAYFVIDYLLSNRDHWSETYVDDKHPYDVELLQELIEEQADDFVVLNRSFSDSTFQDSLKRKGSIIFVEKAFYADTADVDVLIDYVASGNNAILITNRISPILRDILNERFEYSFEEQEELEEGSYSYEEDYYYEEPQYEDEDYYYEDEYNDEDTVTETIEETDEEVLEIYDWYYNQNTLYDSLVEMKLKYDSIDQSTSYIFRRDKKNTFKSWAYIKEDFIYSDSSVIKGYIDGEVNCIEFPIGKGKLLWHSNPIAFSNYFLRKEDKFVYANHIISHLKNGQIIWDSYHNERHETNDYSDYFDGVKKSPLNYILSQEPLKWAWFILLAGIILYLFFTAKRKQSAIPVLFENTNTSIEFTETIGSLYFHNSNHKELCDFKMEMFLRFVRNNYAIATFGIDEEKVVKRIAVKSDVPIEIIEKIVDRYNKIKIYSHITDDALTEFHQLLETFYESCKK